MPQKRILILSFPHSSSMGGGERYTEAMIRGLKKRGYSFSLASSSKALLSVFRKHNWSSHFIFGGFEPVTKLGVLLFILTAPVFLLLNAGLLLWFRFARKIETVICLSMTEKLLVTPLATALKMRVIWVEHLLPGRTVTMNPYRELLLKHATSAEIVTVSEATRRALAKVGYHKERIRVISPGVVLPKSPPGPNDALRVGCVARLHKEKGVMTLVDAFTKVVKRIPDAKLEIYGEGDERELLEKTVTMRKLDRSVTFHGWVDSNEGYYRNFRLLVVPSKKESFGIVALEAMAYGLPVVGSDVGGLSEVIEDKVTGLLVDSGKPELLAETIERLLRDGALCRKLGEAGRRRAESRFTEERFLTAWHTLLND